MALNDEDLAKAREHLKMPDLTAEAALDTLFAANEVALDERDAANVALSRAVQEKEQAVAMSRGGGGAAVDPQLQAARDEVALSRADLMVARGDMPPVVAERIRKLVRPEAGAVSLSRAADGNGLVPVGDVVALFDGTGLAGVMAGEQSGAQVVPLARHTPGEPEPKADPGRQGYEQGEAWKKEQLAQRGIAD